jgi:hypothetical protein
MFSSLRSSTIFLRILAILQLLTGLIAIMPLSWIGWWHHWLGLGRLPDDATLRYVIRGGAFVQAAIGVLVWIIANDVLRYRTLVLAVGWMYLLSGPAFYLIDSIAGMPRFWSLLDGVSCFTVGMLTLAFCPRAEKA